jgi:hypothetical protein
LDSTTVSATTTASPFIEEGVPLWWDLPLSRRHGAWDPKSANSAIPFFCQIGRPCTIIGFVTSRSCAADALSLSLTPPDLFYITCTICRLPGCFHFCGSELLDSGLAEYLNWSSFSCSIPAP